MKEHLEKRDPLRIIIIMKFNVKNDSPYKGME